MRYTRIYESIWDDLEFQGLSDQAQRLFFYLLTCKHNNIIGVYHLPFAYLHNDFRTQKGVKAFRKSTLRDLMASVSATKMLKHDPEMSLIGIKSTFRYNPILYPKQIISAIRVLKKLPKSAIYREIDIQPLNQPFHLPLIQLWESYLALSVSLTLPYPLKEPLPNPEDEIFEKEKKNLQDKLIGISGPDQPDASKLDQPKSKDIKPF